jgi:hypothetical protein
MRGPGTAGTVLMLLTLALPAGCGGDAASSWADAQSTADPAVTEFVELGATASRDELTAAGFALSELPDGAELAGPHYAFTLDSVAVTDELDEPQLRAVNLHYAVEAPLRAGAGHEFLVVYLTEPESGADITLGGDHAVVTVAGQERPLHSVPHADEVIVVSVPAGEDATLAVADAGETKTISLRTGQRVDDSDHAGSTPADRPADALQEGGVQLEEGIQVEGVTPPDQYERLRVRVDLRPSSHVDEQGVAGPGRMWLEVELDLTVSALVLDQAEFALDLAGSLTVQGSDGATLPIPAGTVLEPVETVPASGFSVIQWSEVFEVPDTLRTFEVAYATHGTFTDRSGAQLAFTRVEVTGRGSVELADR